MLGACYHATFRTRVHTAPITLSRPHMLGACCSATFRTCEPAGQTRFSGSGPTRRPSLPPMLGACCCATFQTCGPAVSIAIQARAAPLFRPCSVPAAAQPSKHLVPPRPARNSGSLRPSLPPMLGACCCATFQTSGPAAASSQFRLAPPLSFAHARCLLLCNLPNIWSRRGQLAIQARSAPLFRPCSVPAAAQPSEHGVLPFNSSFFRPCSVPAAAQPSKHVVPRSASQFRLGSDATPLSSAAFVACYHATIRICGGSRRPISLAFRARVRRGVLLPPRLAGAHHCRRAPSNRFSVPAPTRRLCL